MSEAAFDLIPYETQKSISYQDRPSSSGITDQRHSVGLLPYDPTFENKFLNSTTICHDEPWEVYGFEADEWSLARCTALWEMLLEELNALKEDFSKVFGERDDVHFIFLDLQKLCIEKFQEPLEKLKTEGLLFENSLRMPQELFEIAEQDESEILNNTLKKSKDVKATKKQRAKMMGQKWQRKQRFVAKCKAEVERFDKISSISRQVERVLTIYSCAYQSEYEKNKALSRLHRVRKTLLDME